jgi:acetyltransferase-like isoleucine patch superfamily enzyme
MKKIIQRIIQKRNPDFKFDDAVTFGLLLELIADKTFCILRSYKLLLKGRVPLYLMLGRNVRFFNLPNMRFGKWVKLDDYVYLSALGSCQLWIGDNVGIGAHSRIIISTSFNNVGKYIKIGNNVGIGEFAYLGGGGGLEIGDDCIVGQYFSCHPENHNYIDAAKLIRLQGVTRKGIVVGKNCWIGSKVTILDGVTIGDNCVIAAGTVVTKDMPSNVVIGGVPGKIIKIIS